MWCVSSGLVPGALISKVPTNLCGSQPHSSAGWTENTVLLIVNVLLISLYLCATFPTLSLLHVFEKCSYIYQGSLHHCQNRERQTSRARCQSCTSNLFSKSGQSNPQGIKLVTDNLVRLSPVTGTSPQCTKISAWPGEQPPLRQGPVVLPPEIMKNSTGSLAPCSKFSVRM